MKMHLVYLSALAVSISLSSPGHAQLERSDFPDSRYVEGIKHPNSPDEGTQPVHNWAWTPGSGPLRGYSELIPYVLASPDQEEAGSCLYMSLTGILEWWLARLNPTYARTPDGPLDLSERWFMSVSGDTSHRAEIKNWRTDSIFQVNSVGKGVLNVSYRFTKGFYKKNAKGDLIPTFSGSTGASYGTSFNWIDQRSTIKGGYVALPKFERDVLFADPEKNQWNVGVMPEDIVDRVKTALLENQAPVQVLYNHFGYWHALIVLGFDDERDTRGCDFVEKSRAHFKKSAKYSDVSKKLERSVQQRGACNPQGVFYVRDSIYAGEGDPEYVYDPSRAHSLKGATGAYSKRIVMLEYAWLEHLANHAVQIYPKER